MEDSKSTLLIRKELATIDMSELIDSRLDLEESKAQALPHDTRSYYLTYFERILLRHIDSQMKFQATVVNDMEQLQFSKGTINGLFVIRDWFRLQSDIAKDRMTKEKPTDPSDPLPTLSSL